MARTMKWPPRPVNGRLNFVEGIEATEITVFQTLSDLQTNPFNDPFLSLGEIVFRDSKKVRGRLAAALVRLRALIDVEAIIVDRSKEDEGKLEATIHFLDREVRQRSEVTVNG